MLSVYVLEALSMTSSVAALQPGGHMFLDRTHGYVELSGNFLM